MAQKAQQINEKEKATAMRLALSRVGLNDKADVERVFGEASKALTGLKDLEEKATALMDSATIRSVAEELQSRARHDAGVLRKLEDAVKEIEKIPGWRESSLFASQYEMAMSLLDEIAKKNPFARELLKKIKKEEWLEDVKKLREGTITLHEALSKKPPSFFVAARVTILDTEGKAKYGWVRLEGRTKGDKIEARVTEATRNVKFLLNFSYDQLGRKTWVVLNPPEFRTERGEPYFHPIVRQALENLYNFEYQRLEERTRITAGPQDILDGKEGLAIVFHKRWRDFNTGLIGPVKIEVESRQGKIRILNFESPVHDWRELVGQEFDLTSSSMDKRVRRLLQAAAKYQKASQVE